MPEDNRPEPIRWIPTDRQRRPEKGIALCLSGGGYRAMLFHLGALWRLNELAYLPRLERVSSVSGGSITAVTLGARWAKLRFQDGVAQAFEEQVAAPIRSLARTTIDVRSILGGLLVPQWISKRVAAAYRRHLFRKQTLQDLPDKPRFVINATNVQSGVLWRFSKPYMRDYRVGEVKAPRTELAVAVAASSAFPPILSPTTIRLKESDFTPGTGLDLQRRPYTTKVVLSDGGVYDNLGLETAWKRYDTILVSDAGGHLSVEPTPRKNWVSHAYRVLTVIDNQVRSLRKRALINSYIKGDRSGAFWGIRTDIADYHLVDALPCPVEATQVLADTPTRLKKMPDRLQERLINWGYAICDAAMRKHVNSSLPAPAGFPYPNAGIE